MSQVPEQRPSSQPCILVAEDEDSIRDICRRVLNDAGYDVLEAANGQIAIDLLKEKSAHIDLVLADLAMPLAGGEAIADHLSQTGLHIPIIITTGYSASHSPGAFLDRTDLVLLRKPYTLSQLLATVRTALGEV
jgi:CheY-like chemotaxis protein